MEKLKELDDLFLLVNSKNNQFDNYSTVKDKTILAIAEAFRELEQRASNLSDGWLKAISERDEARAKLAEMEKQEPVGYAVKSYAVKRFDNGNFGSWLQSKGMAKGNADYYVVPLFERPAPSAGWEGLIPKKLPMDIQFAAHRIRNGGWNDCINAILRNIEEGK